jgi:hypothetical protein
MLSIRPRARAVKAAAALQDAAREARNVLGGTRNNPNDILAAYREWASAQSVVIGAQIADEDLLRVILTPRYWSLHSIDIGGFTPATLAEYVRQELRERAEFCESEAGALVAEHNRWNPLVAWGHRRFALTAVVLDTNVMLSHHAGLVEVNWHSLLPDVLPLAPLGLALPIEVIRELDRWKLANNNTINRGTKDELRKDAGKALRLIEQIDDPSEAWILRDTDAANQSLPSIRLLLVADRVPGQPLTDPDAEIVDRAASLLPFAESVHLVSYDAAIVFRARLAGVQATKLTYGWDARE